ncbi:MAG TPA: PDZ domain-containing protein [Pyrinomonadaceae bacterium]|nr:PDZ domain-containing protein [Pyrinomonadaceae bacterium]
MKLFIIKIVRSRALLLALLLSSASPVLAQAQRTATPATTQQNPPARVVAQASARPAPQVVTVIHRLSGIKVLRLLRRSNAAANASVEVEDQTFTTRDVHTTILAGLMLSDGRTVITRLPEAVAEVETEVRTEESGNPQQPGTVSISRTVSADIAILQRSGQQIPARYIGWDGATGLSLIQMNESFPPSPRDAVETSISAGQRVRLIAPLPSRHVEASTQNILSLRIAEIEGEIVEVRRGPMSKITGLVIRAQNLSEEMVGGVALNEAGETIGIVEGATGQQARVVPASIVRRAAERVMARRSSVPRPWLGVRGEPVSATSLVTIQSNGWTEEEANALKLARQGILITNVTPGTPAALANLMPGDIIWRVNDAEIRSAEDFSFTLSEAGGGASVLFTVLRGGQINMPALSRMPVVALPTQPQMSAAQQASMHLPEQLAPIKPLSFVIKLSETFDPMVAASIASSGTMAQAVTLTPVIVSDPWTNYGLETITLSDRSARMLGARSGLIVVSVQPQSAAFRAGLRPRDVIESVNGRLLPEGNALFAQSSTTHSNLKLVVIRDRQRLETALPPLPAHHQQ